MHQLLYLRVKWSKSVCNLSSHLSNRCWIHISQCQGPIVRSYFQKSLKTQTMTVACAPLPSTSLLETISLPRPPLVNNLLLDINMIHYHHTPIVKWRELMFSGTWVMLFWCAVYIACLLCCPACQQSPKQWYSVTLWQGLEMEAFIFIW